MEKETKSEEQWSCLDAEIGRGLSHDGEGSSRQAVELALPQQSLPDIRAREARLADAFACHDHVVDVFPEPAVPGEIELNGNLSPRGIDDESNARYRRCAVHDVLLIESGPDSVRKELC